MADVLEVVYAILDHRERTLEDLEAVRREKRSVRGGFADGIVLECVEESPKVPKGTPKTSKNNPEPGTRPKGERDENAVTSRRRRITPWRLGLLYEGVLYEGVLRETTTPRDELLREGVERLRPT